MSRSYRQLKLKWVQSHSSVHPPRGSKRVGDPCGPCRVGPAGTNPPDLMLGALPRRALVRPRALLRRSLALDRGHRWVGLGEALGARSWEIFLGAGLGYFLVLRGSGLEVSFCCTVLPRGLGLLAFSATHEHPSSRGVGEIAGCRQARNQSVALAVLGRVNLQ